MEPSLHATLESVLGKRFAVEREIGRGGVAIVFLARQRDGGELVAIKVLRPELTAFLASQRFQREIAVLKRLDHPNVLPILEAGAAGPLLYLTTPYATGGSLRGRLGREPWLPVDETVRVTRDVAAALDYCHALGIVHRDVKPENILFHDGRALLCDFGLARAVTVSAGEEVSSSGLIIGTPSYMSPEQARGGEVDARTDIYAMACVVYEMLVGETPFTGATAQAILARHAGDPPRSLRVIRSEVSPAIEDVVHAGLAKNPADRPATATAFAEHLASGTATDPIK